MAKLPDNYRYRPAPQSSRPIVSYDGAAMGRSLQKAGEKLYDSGEETYKKQSRFEYERAKSHMLIASIEAENELENDQDFGTYEQRYTERMSKARQEAGALLNDPEMRQMFDMDSEEMLARGTAGIKSKVKRKEIDFGRATLDDQLDRNNQFALQTPDPQTRTSLIQTSNDLIQSAYDRGYLGAEEAVLKRRKNAEDFGKTWVSTQDPDALAAMLQHDTLKPEPHMGKLYNVESRGDPYAKNPKSSAAGLGQFTKKTAKQYGLKDPYDAVANDTASKALWADNRSYLEKNLGREPTDGELYLAHQQGGAGALQLLRDPDQLAVDAVGREEVLLNLPKSERSRVDTITTGEFAQLWTDKYDKADPVTEVKVFKRTGTPLDFLPYEEKIALLGKLPAMQKAAREARETQALDEILPIVQENNGDWKTVPQALQEKAKALGIWDKVTAYKGVSDDSALIDLNTMSPDELLAQNFKSPEWRTKLSRDDLDKYSAKQGEIMNKPEEKALMQTRNQMVEGAFERIGINTTNVNKSVANKNKARIANFNILLDAEIDAYRIRNKGKVIDNGVVQELIDGMFLNKIAKPRTFDPTIFGVFDLFADKDKYAFDLTLDDIPEADRAAITRDLRAAGRPVTQGSMLRLYIMKNGKKNAD